MGTTRPLPKVLSQNLESLGSLKGPDTRFQALYGLFVEAINGLRASSVDYILQDIPKSKKGYEKLYIMLDQHVGLLVTRTKLIGVATTVLKQMSELYRSELKSWEDALQARVESVRNSNRLEDIDAKIRTGERQLAAAISGKPIPDAEEVQW